MPTPSWLGPTAPISRSCSRCAGRTYRSAAPKVYPDLARFTFTGEARSKSQRPDQLLDLIGQALSQSPYLYVFRTGERRSPMGRVVWAAADPSRPVEAAVQGSNGQFTLASALPAEAAEAMSTWLGPGAAQALELLRKAAPNAGPCPGIFAMIGDAALSTGDLGARSRRS